MRRFRLFLLAVAALTVAATPSDACGAQEAPPATGTVTVRVTDRSGQPVTDLQPADLQVRVGQQPA